MQTNLYSATRGCKLYFLFLTNMNMVFALKIHHFSRKTFPLAICLWDVEFCLADGQCRRVTRLCGKEWVPGTWGILFSSDNLWKFYSFNMVKCKCGKEIIYIYILPNCWAQREDIRQWEGGQDRGGYSWWQKPCFKSFSGLYIGFN